MGRWMLVALGAVLAVLGLVGIIALWQTLWLIILAAIVLACFFVGVAMLVFGIGELATQTQTPPPAPPSESEQEKEEAPQPPAQ